MSANRVLAAVALAGAAVTLNACSHAKEALGIQKVTPDEFLVVTKAPLTVPQAFELPPPAPGQPRPQELQPENAARLAMLGDHGEEQRSEGEKLLAQKAGADQADPHAHYVVADELGGIAYKDKSFADRVMFWKAGGSAAEIAQNEKAKEATTPSPVDSRTEKARIKSLTGDKSVIIAKVAPKEKLPGL
jgi:hypothetical protein